MTQKEFKADMLRGLGRCVTAAKRDPERYRKTILWACTKDYAYDSQCEGSRAWYTYTMASCFEDRQPFVDAAANALKKHRPDSSWDIRYLSDLLMHFAQDGEADAKTALEDKYRELLCRVRTLKHRPKPFFCELSELEELGTTLAVDRASVLRVAEDFGQLYREKSFLIDGDFESFFYAKGMSYRRQLENAAKKSENIACFLQRKQAHLSAMEVRPESYSWPTPEKMTSIQRSLWLKKVADRETIGRYALAYREETQPERRAEALNAFSRCPYPDAPRPIIADAQSECEELRNSAWYALLHVRHPSVRAFALSNVENEERAMEVFALLVSNYDPEDAPLLEKLLRRWIAAGDWDSVHNAGLDVNDVFSRDGGPRPKQLLPLVYRYTPCSCCREYFIHHMARHRMLTEEILEECRYDSSDDIRSYAVKKLKRIRVQHCAVFET